VFPLLALAAVALTNNAVAGTAVTIAVGATLFGSNRKRKKLEEQHGTDINPKFEEEFYKAKYSKLVKGLPAKLKSKAKRQLTEEIALIRQGNTDLSFMPFKSQQTHAVKLPKSLQHLAYDYILTPRDEMLLYFVLLREQTKHRDGSVGKLLLELSKKSGVPYEKIERTLFSDREMNESMPAVVTVLRKMSKARLATDSIVKRLRVAADEKQKKDRSR
jgi:hypothetical protein